MKSSARQQSSVGSGTLPRRGNAITIPMRITADRCRLPSPAEPH
jgi:hypothetical protein